MGRPRIFKGLGSDIDLRIGPLARGAGPPEAQRYTKMVELSEYEQQFLSKQDVFYWKTKCKALAARVELLTVFIEARFEEEDDGWEEDCRTLQLPGLAIPFSKES